MSGLFSEGDRSDFGCNTEAERTVLGMLLIKPDSLETVQDLVSSRDFFCDEHRLVFEAILAVSEKGKMVDWITVQEELRRQDVYLRVGNVQFLTGLFDTLPATGDIAQQARIIRLCAVWRGKSPPAL